MNIAVVGYGKMGRMVLAEARRLGHNVPVTMDAFDKAAFVRYSPDRPETLAGAVKISGAEGVIEFTDPAVVVNNIEILLPLRIPLVVGTTGWKDQEGRVAELAAKTNGVVLRSANFSLGVNLFYKVASYAAGLFADYDEYDVALWEGHHNQKADSPSGTAMEIARLILEADKKKTRIVTETLHRRPDPEELTVSSSRVGSMPGSHRVIFDSEADTIEMTHTARNRVGFAVGAVRALERLTALLAEGKLPWGRLYGMEDVL
ncbi:MAG: 4-hydroxy-tetrahydrodipicolinate reductase [Spirochaetaceae bacterium]|jgi:4-hydroxy-tetrahydrodipicolinate reductase|nr:4-hydroxy-tetrahydrodipicolinate reductase [Spirochaetaceae bacterium]